MVKSLHICSLNCQGLGQKEKQQRLWYWKNQQKCDILFIQETHLTQQEERDLKIDFKGNIYHSHGTKH